jgi:hypothetical protein
VNESEDPGGCQFAHPPKTGDARRVALGSLAHSGMTLDGFTAALEDWFRRRYGREAATVEVVLDRHGKAKISVIREGSKPHEPAPFYVDYSAGDALEISQTVIESKMLTKSERRYELIQADVDDPKTCGLIDDFSTDFTITESDRSCLERFLGSSYLETRREALLALMFGVNKEAGPKFTGYAIDGLVLQFLGVLEGSDSQFTGSSILAELRNRGDQEAVAILGLLENNDKWRRLFR